MAGIVAKEQITFFLFFVTVSILVVPSFGPVKCSHNQNVLVDMHGGRIDVHIVDLDDVGGFRAANHSAVVEGALQATFINGERKLSVLGYDVNVYVNVSHVLVRDWKVYSEIVRKANNVIIVNTHDEILPIPAGYSKEEWIAEIADFMLNRWGTWVHIGGLPFHIIHYQNGTIKEWDEGFNILMKHVDLNLAIQNPPKPSWIWKDNVGVELTSHALSCLSDFCVKLEGDHNHRTLTTFIDAIINYTDKFNCSLRFTETDPSIVKVYGFNSTEDLNFYAQTAGLRLSMIPDKYGVFIYSGPVGFLDGNGDFFSDNDNSIGMGAVATATSIWCDAGYAAQKICEAEFARSENEALFQNTIDLYGSGAYKQAVIHAEKAMVQQQDDLILPIAFAAFGAMAILVLAVVHRHNNNHKIKPK